MNKIVIQNAYQNNLKNINVELPKGKFIVFSGLSGSGKSTLALDILQRECQRQYMESMGMTIEVGTKPMVGIIEGLSPAISINQSHVNRNPRSTVGTVTEISPYLRILFEKLGERPCPYCGAIVKPNYEMESDLIFADDTEQSNESDLYEQMIPCPCCSKPIIELTASHFSFNKPLGACPTCKGVGVVSLPDINLLIDQTKSIKQFSIEGWDQVYIDRYGSSLKNAAKHYGFDINIETPICEYDEKQMDLLLYGVLSKQIKERFPNSKPPKTVPEGRFEGVVTNLMRRYEEKKSYSSKQRLEKIMIQKECPECLGIRFRKEILQVTVGGKNIREIVNMPLIKVSEWLINLKCNLPKEARNVVSQVIEDLIPRVQRIVKVGAGYLRLNQAAASVSPGEMQRIKLASILGSSLTGVLYILDEPSTGLHKCDIPFIINVLKELRDKGNTVIVIEHDISIIREADYIVDFGPGAGKNGGRVVAAGSISQVMGCPDSITGKYLGNNIEKTRRNKKSENKGFLIIRNANKNNLKNIQVEIPLQKFVTVAGVSGAGKSSLVFGEIAYAASNYFESSNKVSNNVVTGFERLDGVTLIDQASIGRSARSNAATYTDIFTDIRNLFAKIAAVMNSNLEARDFSYNTPGGRCEKCQGAGSLTVSMNFLPDVEVVCPVCHGKRYKREVLTVKYKGHSISDVLDLSIDEAKEVFQEENDISKKLLILQEVGLGYLGLGQSASTLSGGEAQRLKLAKELIKAGKSRVLYLFDEPTRGLHPHDVNRLIHVFDRLVEKGNSVIVIDHNKEVILASDWVIELGPKGGEEGGTVIAEGTPEELKKNENSITGKILY